MWAINIIPAKDYRLSPEVNIQVCLEFCPDKPKDPESPLDDIRKMLKDEQ
ncbi:KGK domain-containing protein [Microcoleus sp. FACHB-831]|nr:KGK domain-containing protein [Microcoleus sp. FACHB-831]